MSAIQWDVAWHDMEREPQVAPNPAYPDGKDIDATGGGSPACTVLLPYPAKRIGVYMVHCKLCGLRVAITTAGRPDDPRSARVLCKALDSSG